MIGHEKEDGHSLECRGNPKMIQKSRAPLVLASDKCSNDEVREESRGIDLAQVSMFKQSQRIIVSSRFTWTNIQMIK